MLLSEVCPDQSRCPVCVSTNSTLVSIADAGVPRVGLRHPLDELTMLYAHYRDIDADDREGRSSILLPRVMDSIGRNYIS